MNQHICPGVRTKPKSFLAYLGMLFSDFWRYFRAMRHFMSRLATIMTSNNDFLARASWVIRTAHGRQLEFRMCIRTLWTFGTESR